MCNNRDRDCGLGDLLRSIMVLQQNAISSETGLDSCDRNFLGCGSPLGCNTRPVILYPCCGNPGEPLFMPTSKTINGESSQVFRIEKIDDCSATFRVLSETESGFIATNSFVTVDITKLLCVRCLSDTFVECI